MRCAAHFVVHGGCTGHGDRAHCTRDRDGMGAHGPAYTHSGFSRDRVSTGPGITGPGFTGPGITGPGFTGVGCTVWDARDARDARVWDARVWDARVVD